MRGMPIPRPPPHDHSTSMCASEMGDPGYPHLLVTARRTATRRLTASCTMPGDPHLTSALRTRTTHLATFTKDTPPERLPAALALCRCTCTGMDVCVHQTRRVGRRVQRTSPASCRTAAPPRTGCVLCAAVCRVRARKPSPCSTGLAGITAHTSHALASRVRRGVITDRPPPSRRAVRRRPVHRGSDGASRDGPPPSHRAVPCHTAPTRCPCRAMPALCRTRAPLRCSVPCRTAPSHATLVPYEGRARSAPPCHTRTMTCHNRVMPVLRRATHCGSDGASATARLPRTMPFRAVPCLAVPRRAAAAMLRCGRVEPHPRPCRATPSRAKPCHTAPSHAMPS